MAGVLKVSIYQLKKFQTVKLHTFITNLIGQYKKIFKRVHIYLPRELRRSHLKGCNFHHWSCVKILVDHPSSEMAHHMDYHLTPIPWQVKLSLNHPTRHISIPSYRLSWLITLQAAASPSVSAFAVSTGGWVVEWQILSAGCIWTGITVLVGYSPHNCIEPECDHDIGL